MHMEWLHPASDRLSAEATPEESCGPAAHAYCRPELDYLGTTVVFVCTCTRAMGIVSSPALVLGLVCCDSPAKQCSQTQWLVGKG